jgi:hypothetical protein
MISELILTPHFGLFHEDQISECVPSHAPFIYIYIYIYIYCVYYRGNFFKKINFYISILKLFEKNSVFNFFKPKSILTFSKLMLFLLNLVY